MVVTCVPFRQVFWNWQSEFRVVSCEPVGEIPEDMELNSYGNFTIGGNNIADLALNEEITVTIKPDTSSRYEASYNLVGTAGMVVNDNKIDIEPSQEYSILCRFMTKGQAKNVNTAYPNFIQLVMDGKDTEIDYNKIKNVGAVYLSKYIEKLSAERNKLMLLPVASTYGIDSLEDIEKIMMYYSNANDLKMAFDSNPYEVICKHLEYPFNRADKLILAHKSEWIDTVQRCEYACISILKQNEEEGDTRINANVLSKFVRDLAPETMDKIVDAVTHSDRIYYDPNTKYAALTETYEAEQVIAKEICQRVKDPEPTPMDWEQFKTVDGFECTEEQIKILRLACEQSVMMLTGSAGCVDCDTEFFTGTGWKRIADYQDGDKVLQYNQDGNAELVKPLAYFKKPCDYLWHFETHHSINQTVCDKHRIIYKWKNYEELHETNVLELKRKSENNINWNGQFITQFFHFGHGIKLTDEQIRVMIAVMADGRYSTWENPNSLSTHCRIRLKKERKILRLRKLLSAANIEYSEIVDKDGVTIFRFYAPERRKVYGGDWWDVNKHQAKIICEEVVNWDGQTIKSRVNKKEKPCFRTTEKQSADYIQYIFIINGWQSTIKNYNNSPSRQNIKKIVYFVTTKHNNLSGLCFDNREGITKTQFVPVATTDGYKYCFTVPSSMLVLRRENCVFITGNCGKTSSIKAVVKMLEQNNTDYLLLTPTGISAKRLKEVTGRPTSTAHRALACGSLQGFNGVLILEESSMLGVHLLSEVLSQLSPKCKIIFICDPAQLASISCGNIVQDIIDTGIVPTATLTKVFRYGIGGIATISTDTRSGTPFKPPYDFADYTYMPCNKNAVEQALNAYESLLQQGYNKTNIMMLCPYNKTKVGTYVLNEAIQNRYNLHKDTDFVYERDHQKIMFKVGDKVVNTTNDYHMPSAEIDGNGEYMYTDEFGRPFTIPVMNGDIGYVRDIFEGEKPKMLVEFDNGLGIIDSKNIKNLLLGYALSIHRVQGAQAKAVIVLIDKSHKTMLSRNLLYVGLSRAQEKLIEIGDVDVINSALEVEENKTRDTWLKDLLKEETT